MTRSRRSLPLAVAALAAGVVTHPATAHASTASLLRSGPPAQSDSSRASFRFAAPVRVRLDGGRWRRIGRRMTTTVSVARHRLRYQRLSRDIPRGAVHSYGWRVLAAPRGAQTSWRAVGSPPLADATAARAVVPEPEVRAGNVQANDYLPSDSELAAFHAARGDQGETEAAFSPWRRYVTGRSGLTNATTDELIQWTALKWGIPVDVVRAQMAIESWWHHEVRGDRTAVANPQDYPAFSRIPGTSDVYQSLGISQVRWPIHPGTEPLRWRSTAFALDVYGAEIRFYYDGLAARWGHGMTDRGYGPGQEWLSIGAWFNPYPWNNAGQQDYVRKVRGYLSDRVWEKPDFRTG